MSGKFIDAYSVLQIGSDADDAAVRARHRELAKQFHPDRGGRAADGELMMRINRARDVLLDPVARAILDEELARRQRQAAATPAAEPPAAPGAPGAPSPTRGRRWRAEWGTEPPQPAPAADGAAPGQGQAPPPSSQMRPSVGRLRQATRQARAASVNPALSPRRRAAGSATPPQASQSPQSPQSPQSSQPPGETDLPRRRQATPPRVPRPPAKRQARAQAARPEPAPQQSAPAAQSAPKATSAPRAEKTSTAWSLYAVPLDGVSIAAFVASVIMCGPLGFILGVIGLARTADDKRRGRWAAVAGLAISSLTMLVAIGYVMQAMAAPGP